jgi:hypothetical protein
LQALYLLTGSIALLASIRWWRATGRARRDEAAVVQEDRPQ